MAKEVPPTLYSVASQPAASGASSPTPVTAASRRATNLNHPTYYLNRELSWLEFNRRVLEEALDASNPLLERVRFLSIFGSNLDEFFMVRVSGLKQQMEAGVITSPPDGMGPVEQLKAIRDRVLPMLKQSLACWREDLKPKLDRAGIHVLAYDELKRKQRKLLRRHFKSEIFPILTPLAFDPGHPFPHISSLSLNLAVVIQDPMQGERFARLKVPATLPRLLRVPDEEKAEEYEGDGLADVKAFNFVWIDEVVAGNLDLLFPGLEVTASFPFRVTRDADLEIEEDEASDLLTAMAEVVEQRHFGSAIRLEIDDDMPPRIRDVLAGNLKLQPFQVYTTDSPVGLAGLAELADIDRPDLKFPPFLPVVPPSVAAGESLFTTLKRRDVLLYHPYDSFNPVVNFLHEAARDPQVVAIKQTLYRVGPDSPIVQALMEARQHGKQVAVLVELKARFDEQANIVWAQALEQAGVHVVYGVMGLKTHVKACLVVRREEGRIRRYVHMGTGNYNAGTARVYTDLGLFTADPVLADDISDLFNYLTGYSRQRSYQKLLVAPAALREEILQRIEREIERHKQSGDGHLIFKMNSLVDKASIRALYQASQAGVRVDLIVRGICCLRPGVPRVSETITVRSVVGRFLEHARIFYFRNGGDEEVFAGSADLMPRNLDGRVEAVFPVEDAALKRAIRDDILMPQLRDNVRARDLDAEGHYTRAVPPQDESALDCQEHLLESGGGWRLEE